MMCTSVNIQLVMNNINVCEPEKTFYSLNIIQSSVTFVIMDTLEKEFIADMSRHLQTRFVELFSL